VSTKSPAEGRPSFVDTFRIEPTSEWILSRARWADDGYASAEIEPWNEGRRLVAYATQMMLIRFPDPDEFA
jgi:hypothetical protein